MPFTPFTNALLGLATPGTNTYYGVSPMFSLPHITTDPYVAVLNRLNAQASQLDTSGTNASNSIVNRLTGYLNPPSSNTATTATGYSQPASASNPNTTNENDIGAGDGTGIYQWRSQITQASKTTGTPANVLGAIMMNESGGTNYGANGDGAEGIMQIIPKYFPDLVDKYGSPTDPQAALNIAGTVLKEYHDKAMSQGTDDQIAWVVAAQAYFAGWAGRNNPNASDGHDTVTKYGDDFSANLKTIEGQQAQIPDSQPATSTSSKSGSAPLATAIDTAYQYLGTPYQWGGSDPSTNFDCSGLVQYAYKQAGINLPRVAQDQYDATQRITADQLQAGDLVFFTQTYDAGTPVSHVGIYLGNGQMLDDQNDGVVVDNLSDPYWQQHLYGYGRVSS